MITPSSAISPLHRMTRLTLVDACILLSPRRTTRAFFFFNDTATTEIYTLSLHDALPILDHVHVEHFVLRLGEKDVHDLGFADRKSTRLNSSHSQISYAVFCLKKKIRATRSAIYVDGARHARC